MNFTLRYLLLCLPLAACGGGSTHDSDTNTKKADYSQLSEQHLEPGSLRQASATELEQLLKNGLRVSLKNNQNFDTLVRAASVNNTADDVKTEAGGHSITNVQVQGVDEADSVKYDGHYIYLATPTLFTDTGATTSIKIFATDTATAKATEVSTTNLDTTYWGDISELYLVSNEQATTSLATLRRSWNYIALMNTDVRVADSSIWWPHSMKQGIDIRLYDVRSPASLSKSWSLSIDGNLLSSRKIGNKLYIVSSFIPSIETLDYSDGTDSSNAAKSDARIRNENLIADTRIEKLLPEYVINDGNPQPLISSSGCLIPVHTDKNQGSLNIINITTVDLNTQQLLNSECISSNVDGIYTSLNNVYLGGSDHTNWNDGIDWNDWKSFTLIHKFALVDSGVTYQASGSVEGILGWNQPSFRMDEYNDYLRIVTTDYGNFTEPKHLLNVLHKVTGRSELEVVAHLPNAAHPEPIGKPKEDIYSVRFHGAKAYVVTFERKDPLYVLDLATATDPKLAGRLEIPGFATYLHPVGENYLFSLGMETDTNGLQTGVKASLYDIRDMTKPTLINAIVFGNSGSWSSALYDYRAISFLQASNDQLRIAFPMTEIIEANPTDLLINETHPGLKLFEINGLTQHAASLDFAGEVIDEPAASGDSIFRNGNERGILHDNAAFYVHGATVNGKKWRMTAP